MLKPVLVVLTLAQGGDATHLALTSADTAQDCAAKAQAVQKVLEGAGHTVLAARCAEVDAVGRTAALLREGGAGRGALAAERDA